MASGPAGAVDNPPTYTEATSSPAGAVGGYTQPAGGPSAAGYTSPPTAGYTSPPPAGFGTQAAGYSQPTGAALKHENYNDFTGGYQAGAAPGVYNSAPPGYQPVSQQPYAPGTLIAVQQPPAVVVVGGCPACRVGVLEDDFTFLGVCCAILFFPLGILCCLAMRQRHCPNCGAIFS